MLRIGQSVDAVHISPRIKLLIVLLHAVYLAAVGKPYMRMKWVASVNDIVIMTIYNIRSHRSQYSLGG